MTDKIYLFDTVRSNPRAGGVLAVVQALQSASTAVPNVVIVSEAFPKLFKLGRILPGGRFLLEIALLNLLHIKALIIGHSFRYLFPNYFVPFAFKGAQLNSLVVVHDLQFKHLPDFFSRKKRWWLNYSLRRAAASGAKVCYISETTRRDFQKYYSPKKSGPVIYNPLMLPVLPNPQRTGKSDYLVASYHYYPHKNFAGTLDLFIKLRAYGVVKRLIITGSGKDSVEKLLAEKGGVEGVEHLGFVSREQLYRLYDGALAFVSMSRFEGFNLSAAEAASLGVPIIISDIPVHNELFSAYGCLLSLDLSNWKDVASYLSEFENVRPTWRLTGQLRPDQILSQYLKAIEAEK